MFCKHCSNEKKSIKSLRSHEIRCKANPNRLASAATCNGLCGGKQRKTNSNQYIKGTQKPLTPEQRKRCSDFARNIEWTHEKRKRHSDRMKQVAIENPEAYTSSNRGRTKVIEFDGVKFQGKWELEFYVWAKENNLLLVRPVVGFPYEWSGKRTYYPDFYCAEQNTYFEVKGYTVDRDLAKWKYFPHPIKIIDELCMKAIKNKNFSLSGVAYYQKPC